jgi:hypothetical protein
MKSLIIDRLAFLNWHFQDVDITTDVYTALLDRKKYTLNIEDLLEGVGYIPEWILVDGQQFEVDEDGDICVNNISIEFN